MIINILSYINMLKKILSYEKQWCDTMKIHNPYYDNLGIHYKTRLVFFLFFFGRPKQHALVLFYVSPNV